MLTIFLLFSVNEQLNVSQSDCSETVQCIACIALYSMNTYYLNYIKCDLNVLSVILILSN